MIEHVRDLTSFRFSINRQYKVRLPVRLRKSCKSTCQKNVREISVVAAQPDHEHLFRYTSGRWLWNEEEQLSARFRRFNVEQLKQTAARSVGAKSCTSIEKIGQGGYNKVFRLTTDDGRAVIARIPNPNAGPAFLTTASEVATMDFVGMGYPSL